MNAGRTLTELAPEARDAALAALDEISRPMLPAEIADALHGYFTRRERRLIGQALAPFAVVVMHPPA